MSNYDKMAASASVLFLEYDQDKLLHTYPLKHDDDFIYMRMLGVDYEIDRASGAVLRANDGAPAEPRQTLIILDMVCNRIGQPQMTGTWCTMSEVSGAQSSPQTSSLFDEKIACFEGDPGRLDRACKALGGIARRGGEVSYEFEVFDGLFTWMQFWDGDDEFPAQMKFLWDKSTSLYLHFETLWYVLYEILDGLLAVE